MKGKIMKDKEFLLWVHDRLERYGENPNLDFMVRLRSIVTAECLKDEAVAEALARQAKREKVKDLRGQIKRIEFEIDNLNPYATEGLRLAAISRLEAAVCDELDIQN